MENQIQRQISYLCLKYRYRSLRTSRYWYWQL